MKIKKFILVIIIIILLACICASCGVFSIVSYVQERNSERNALVEAEKNKLQQLCNDKSFVVEIHDVICKDYELRNDNHTVSSVFDYRKDDLLIYTKATSGDAFNDTTYTAFYVQFRDEYVGKSSFVAGPTVFNSTTTLITSENDKFMWFYFLNNYSSNPDWYPNAKRINAFTDQVIFQIDKSSGKMIYLDTIHHFDKQRNNPKIVNDIKLDVDRKTLAFIYEDGSQEIVEVNGKSQELKEIIYYN